MVKKKQQLCIVTVCLQHNNKYIKLKDKGLQKKILSKNYSIYVRDKLFKITILKKKNNYIKNQLLNA